MFIKTVRVSVIGVTAFTVQVGQDLRRVIVANSEHVQT